MDSDNKQGGESLRKLTAQEFIDICSGELRNTKQYSKFYKKHHERGAQVNIKDVLIEEDVEFPASFVAHYSIHIYSGEFKKNLAFSGSFESNLIIFYGVFHHGIVFSRAKFIDSVVFGGGIYKHLVRINYCQFASPLQVRGGIFHNGLSLTGGAYLGAVGFSGGIYQKSLSIDGCDFSDDVEISGGDIEMLFVLAGNFRKEFNISGGNFKEGVRIWGGGYNNFTIAGGVVGKGFELIEGRVKEYLTLNGGDISSLVLGGILVGKEVLIKSLIVSDTLTIYGGEPLIFKISPEESCDVSISELRFLQNSKFDASIFGGEIDVIRFADSITTRDSIITINNLVVRQILFEQYINLGYINFTSIRATPYVDGVTEEEQSIIKFVNSSLGNTQFINCDLSSFSNFVFEGSDILGISLVGTKMPSVITHQYNHERGKTYVYEQEQNGYAQLKKIYQNRGDLVSANEYYSREMDAYRKTLPNSSLSIPRWLIRVRDEITSTYNKLPERIKSLPEELTLLLNFFSNDHGRSWVRALAFTMFISAVFFFAYSISIGFTIEFSQNGWSRFIALSSHMGEFMLPFHRPGFLENDYPFTDESGWSRIWDFSGRIFISYGIYQFIQAFRKHGKS